MSCTVNHRGTIDFSAPLVRVRDDAVTAFNCAADVVDFLDVVDMAMAEISGQEPFSQLTTVLSAARRIAIEAREASNRTCAALSKEIGL